ncbi:hypothetical protein M8009_12920 [Halomonas sp. ATCH28]|uniref:Uncharacterized protein n=1 Tax=Halomonas gemina TaxID=2945105 RepID=A0ABT0T2N0_9GAMM|nr:hypothetical protein [Halomonas gemina]MCL7941188.1 hypothetical protein [Halomonas gemina]
MAEQETRLLIGLAPWLLVAAPLAGVIIVYLTPRLPWRLIALAVVVALIVVEVL